MDACVACSDALADPHVSVGDRITLQRRLQRFQKVVGAAATAKRRRREGGVGSASAPPAAPSTPGSSTAHLDTLKAVALSVWTDRVGNGSATLPAYMCVLRGWVGAQRSVVTVAGNPLNRVTGEKSRFIGQDAGDGDVVVPTCVVDGVSLPNFSTSVARRVEAAGVATAAWLKSLHGPRQASGGRVRGEEEEEEPDIDVAVAGRAVSPVVSVEEYVLQHYGQTGGWLGSHCEGRVFHSLFALLMWEVRRAPRALCTHCYTRPCVAPSPGVVRPRPGCLLLALPGRPARPRLP